MRIPVFIVDDEEVDRLIARVRIERSEHAEHFGPIVEVETGDRFLCDHLDRDAFRSPGALRPLVLMDINMPGRNGFETVEELTRKCQQGALPNGVVVVMFSTSDDDRDRARAESLSLVSGQIYKPFKTSDIDMILSIYEADGLATLSAPGQLP
ncbi:MAG: response regulator [Silicimonas sp.]|nr:response regulator [Silicimonas sp.]